MVLNYDAISNLPCHRGNGSVNDAVSHGRDSCFETDAGPADFGPIRVRGDKANAATIGAVLEVAGGWNTQRAEHWLHRGRSQCELSKYVDQVATSRVPGACADGDRLGHEAPRRPQAQFAV